MVQNIKCGNNASFIILQVIFAKATSTYQNPAALKIVTEYNDQFDIKMMICEIYGIQPIADVGNWNITIFFEDSW